jgi:hypothetical protein
MKNLLFVVADNQVVAKDTDDDIASKIFESRGVNIRFHFYAGEFSFFFHFI